MTTGMSCGAIPYSSTNVYAQYEGLENYQELYQEFNTKIEKLIDDIQLGSVQSIGIYISHIRNLIDNQTYDMNEVVDSVKNIHTQTAPDKLGIGTARVHELTTEFLAWYDDINTVRPMQSDDNNDALNTLLAIAKTQGIEDELNKLLGKLTTQEQKDLIAALLKIPNIKETIIVLSKIEGTMALIDTIEAVKAGLDITKQPDMTDPNYRRFFDKVMKRQAANIKNEIKDQIKPPKILDGFTTSTASEYKPIDAFSSVTGSLSCIETSANLTNSMGPLCLPKPLLDKLRSRGGNATSGESQIGF